MKSVLITGAAGGLGLALVRVFGNAGYHVVATDVPDKIRSRVESEKLIWFALDVTRRNEIEKLHNDLIDKGIKIQVLVNNAGYIEFFPIIESKEELINIFKVNSFGPVNMIREFLPDLKSSSGRVINITSESHKIPGLFQPYPITKSTLHNLSIAMRQELSLLGVKLSMVQPGAIDTPLITKMDVRIESPELKPYGKKFSRKAKDFIGRISSPEQVAQLVLKVASKRKPKTVYRINNNPVLKLLGFLPVGLYHRVILSNLKIRDKSV